MRKCNLYTFSNICRITMTFLRDLNRFLIKFSTAINMLIFKVFTGFSFDIREETLSDAFFM